MTVYNIQKEITDSQQEEEEAEKTTTINLQRVSLLQKKNAHACKLLRLPFLCGMREQQKQAKKHEKTTTKKKEKNETAHNTK